MSREMQIRSYTVAGQTFTVALEEPWHFMEYTPVVADRIQRAAAGEVLGITPVRAGDDVPARTYVTAKEDLPADMDRYTLDFSQYEPFAEQGQAESLFTLRIQAAYPQWLEEVLQDRSVLQEILRVDNQLPWYYIFRLPDGRTLYEFEPTPGKIAGYLVVDKGDRDADYFPAPNLGPYSTMHQISTVLMILYNGKEHAQPPVAQAYRRFRATQRRQSRHPGYRKGRPGVRIPLERQDPLLPEGRSSHRRHCPAGTGTEERSAENSRHQGVCQRHSIGCLHPLAQGYHGCLEQNRRGRRDPYAVLAPQVPPRLRCRPYLPTGRYSLRLILVKFNHDIDVLAVGR